MVPIFSHHKKSLSGFEPEVTTGLFKIVTIQTKLFASAGSVEAARFEHHRTGDGANPIPALHLIRVTPIDFSAAKRVLVRHHYLHSMPGGTQICLGALVEDRLLGVLTFGVGPTNAHRLVKGATPSDCVTLTRLWLSDELPKNSESRVLGIALRGLRAAPPSSSCLPTPIPMLNM